MAKKGLGTWLLGIGAAFLIYKQIKGKVDSYQFFDYSVTGAKINVTNPIQPKIDLNISTYNPNNLPVPVNAIFGELYSSTSLRLGTFTNSEPINIGGKTNASIKITVLMNSLSAIQHLAQLRLNKKMSRSITMKAIVKTGFFDQQITNTFSI
jgi:LEA14-like dessication related protein